MKVFIWHHNWPNYEERMRMMGLPSSIGRARRAAYDQLALVPKE